MKKVILFLFLTHASFLFAQKEITGKVTETSGTALPGVNVLVKGTSVGVSTDFEGSFKIEAKEGETLVFSYLGFGTVEKMVDQGNVIDVIMSDGGGGQVLEDVTIVGSRAAPRSNVTSALPIDVLSSKDLVSTGQNTFDKALQYKIPSFNTVQTPVNDATSLLDPYEIRNMGPSRTLILINGKRKNMSALVYTQTSPGRGETGADISAIPTDAIEKVEILRDGASAQYGSDAIAGVMNIILKKNTTFGSATLRTGITSEGDGEMYGISLNNGSTVGQKGFINYTVDFSKVELANRPGKVDAAAEADSNTGFGADINVVNAFLSKYPDAGNVNGSPETAAAKFLVNGGVNYSETTQLYYNAAYVYKKVNSFANYRTPYWRTLNDYPYLLDIFGDGVNQSSYVGYVPTFIGDLNDYNATLGYKSKINGWNTDVSITTGGNKQIYTVENSHNRSDIVSYTIDPLTGLPKLDPNTLLPITSNVYRENSPITFKPGGTSFNHIVGNLDISKVLSDEISIGFGSEFRTENFEIFEGDKASYDGLGADSFQGNTPDNSGKFNRYNLGAYFDVAYDVNKDFLINGTVRYEDYSDFGNATVWKLSSRYKLLDDKLTFRGSLSTGFRAPSLHQIYTQKSQSTFAAGGAIVITGLVNNVSASARTKGVPKLKAEKSDNLTLGFGFKPTSNFNLTVDYYNIKITDRIILGDLIDFGPDGQQAFFVNGIGSRTEGIDFVAGYKNIQLGSGKLALNLSGNYTTANRTAGAINNPASVKASGQTIFSDIQRALLFTSRPKFKYIFGGDYEINKFGFSLNNTVFGPTKFKNAGMSDDLRIEFLTKIVTDLGVNYSATEKLTLALNVNNLLNVLPEWQFKAENADGEALINNPSGIKEQFNLITFNGRYSQMTYDGYHFSQLGTMFNLSLNYKF
ncbi:TonB-dependent receptor domain-containing protein [Flavobacterium sp.]|uniref:TonB-dependent receptor n=1 Tax=Flavobacterium sp. TaxID=239 RepID=UPI00375346FE